MLKKGYSRATREQWGAKVVKKHADLPEFWRERYRDRMKDIVALRLQVTQLQNKLVEAQSQPLVLPMQKQKQKHKQKQKQEHQQTTAAETSCASPDWDSQASPFDDEMKCRQVFDVTLYEKSVSGLTDFIET